MPLLPIFRRKAELHTQPAVSLYLELLKGCLTRSLFLDRALLGDLSTSEPASLDMRYEGKDWPTEAETMVGVKRLDNLQQCITEVLLNGTKGDLVEAGVWRGGASIFMRGVLKANGVEDRRVWLADSFAGLPAPDPLFYPQDAGDIHHTLSPYLGVPLERVRANFERYGLLDSQVEFLEGWFKDTLPVAPISQIAVLRLDGDMYESTTEALTSLYDRVSKRGFVIIDDYGALPNCRAAVHDFRNARNRQDPIHTIDWTGAFWQKS